MAILQQTQLYCIGSTPQIRHVRYQLWSRRPRHRCVTKLRVPIVHGFIGTRGMLARGVDAHRCMQDCVPGVRGRCPATALSPKADLWHAWFLFWLSCSIYNIFRRSDFPVVHPSALYIRPVAQVICPGTPLLMNLTDDSPPPCKRRRN